MRICLAFPAFLVATLLWTGEVRAEELGHISGMESREIAVVGFDLARAQEVEIEAVMARGGDREGPSQTWILAAPSREVVWRPGEVETLERSRFLHRWRQRVELAAGSYELYFASWSGAGNRGSTAEPTVFESLVRDVVGFSTPTAVLADLEVTVRGEGRAISADELLRRRHAAAAGTVLQIRGVGDGALEERGFVLRAPATVEVYAVGELSEGGRSDWGWLVDADSRRLLWEMSWEGTQPGGGWDRNRTARLRLELPAGRYAAGFQTDDGHSPDGWTAAPPFDPESWGLRVRCLDGPGCATVQATASDRLPPALVIARITGLGDGEHRELPFHLGGPARLRVYAVGEGTSDRMWDHGWIENATGEPVWQMQSDAVRPAGGAAKNVRIDQVVELAEGDYVAIFETDGSHSAGGGWNAPPPFEPEMWGMTILAPPSGLRPN